MTAINSGKNGSNGKAGQTSTAKIPMTPARAAAIQSHAMKTTGTVKAGSFPARAQAGAAHNVNADIVTATPTGKP